MAAARGRPAATSAMTHAEASLRPMLTENTMDYKMRDKGWSKGKTARSVVVTVQGETSNRRQVTSTVSMGRLAI